MKLNELSRQTGIYTQTLRYKAKQLFGRSSGEFNDDECAMILECFTQKTALLAKWNKRQALSENKRQALSENKRQALSENSNHTSVWDKRTIRKKGYGYMKDADIMRLDAFLFWLLPNYKAIPNRVLVLRNMLDRLQNMGIKEVERLDRLNQQTAKEFNEWLDEFMSEEVNVNSVEMQWKLLQHPANPSIKQKTLKEVIDEDF